MQEIKKKSSYERLLEKLTFEQREKVAYKVFFELVAEKMIEVENLLSFRDEANFPRVSALEDCNRFCADVRAFEKTLLSQLEIIKKEKEKE